MTQEVLFETLTGQGGDLGVMTLNRPAVLNSLSHDMICALHKQLTTWATDTSIKAVVIQAAPGRAFCAGGDLRLTYDRARAGDNKMTAFFHEEYLLNRLIFHYPKPYIALLDGITMGGGVGVSIHGSHRVASEHLMFAMPETGIGFFPDVGGTHFLPRLPGKLGYYLGLTGARLNVADAVGVGLVQHHVLSEQLSTLREALANTAFGAHANQSVTDIIRQHETAVAASPLCAQQALVDDLFKANTVEEIVQQLEQHAEPFCQDMLKKIRKKSPTSLKVTLKALREGEKLDFDAVMQQEYRLTCHFLKAHDFLEGIRAVIIDKDQTPAWQPAALTEVNEHDIDHYFAPITEELVY